MTIYMVGTVHQTEQVKRALSLDAVNTVAMPTLEIVSTADEHDEASLATSFPQGCWVIATSIPSIRCAPQRLPKTHVSRWLAVGPQTARVIEDVMGVSEVLMPDRRFGHRPLLKLPIWSEESTKEKHIVVLTGEDSSVPWHELLANQVKHLDVYPVYRRCFADSASSSVFMSMANRRPGEDDILVSTSLSSLEGFVHWLKLSKAHDAFYKIKLLVTSEKTERQARKYGFKGELRQVLHASDQGLAKALRAWQADIEQA